jgi:outer membrane phospholipase A
MGFILSSGDLLVSKYPASVLASCLFHLLTVAALMFAPSATAEWLLSSRDPHVKPGESFEVIIASLDEHYDWQASFPANFPALIEFSHGGPRVAIKLLAVSSDAGTTHRRYVARWPAEINGLATLSLQDVPSSRILLDASPRPRAEKPEMAGLEPSRLESSSTASAPPEPSALTFNEPMYFVVGGRPDSARFQLSFRYRMFDSQSIVGENLPFARGLYFGYTQTSLWDLSSDSRPFRDTSFRPSLFYQWQLKNPEDTSSASLTAGFEHESNGRDGKESRSINTLFMQADFLHYFGGKDIYLGMTPKIWGYIDKEDNPDIPKYRGYGQLSLRLGSDDNWQAAALLRRGTNRHYRSTQLDLSYPLRRSIFSGVGAFVHLQYFNGYGETLLDYNHHSSRPQFRIGFSLVR